MITKLTTMDRTRGLEELGINLDNLVGNSTTCPECSQWRTKSSQRCLSVNLETGNYYCNHCGWQGRADSDEWLDKGYSSERTSSTATPSELTFNTEKKEITFLPKELYKVYADSNSHFTQFLYSHFDRDSVERVIQDYNIRSTNQHWPNSVIFFQQDFNGNIRQLKIMDYDPKTGKRFKEIVNGTERSRINIAGKRIAFEYDIENPNLKQCFFGEHLLRKFPGKPVGIVEAEKTAIIASICIPELNWIATGGKNSCQWYKPNTFEVLRGKVVEMYPDNDEYESWLKRVQENSLEDIALVNVRDDFYRREKEGEEKWDLADYLLTYMKGSNL